ncbi:MAG: glycosyltransferase family 87 protein [Bacteroidia bacterium]
MHKNRFTKLLLNSDFVLVVFILFAVAAAVGQYLKGKPGESYTRYNNFIIFRESFHHLVHYIDLYINHEPEHFDYYKYSPAFAVAMAPFTFLPDLPGLILWDVMNALVLFFAIKNLPVKNETVKIYILWFVLIELMTTMQNSQSNGLVVAFLVWGFNQFEKRNVFLASLFILLSAYIKIYGVLACLLFLFYPDKIKFILYAALWMLVLTFIPLLFVNIDQLLLLYKSWYNIVMNDYSNEYGISLIGILHKWFHVEPGKNLLLLTGVLLLCLPLARTSFYKESNFRLTWFASLLLWIIIFNPRAESSTFVIAITGIALWFFNSEKKPVDVILVISALIITSFSPTDLFPRYLREQYVLPYVLKALPCILIWIKITIDLFTKKSFPDSVKVIT